MHRITVRIQGVLCVDEDDFPARVAVITWQLSSDWTKTPQGLINAANDFGADVSKSLLTHHKAYATAEFSPCETLWE